MERYLIEVENEVREKIEEIENGYFNSEDRTAFLSKETRVKSVREIICKTNMQTKTHADFNEK